LRSRRAKRGDDIFGSLAEPYRLGPHIVGHEKLQTELTGNRFDASRLLRAGLSS
jgi:hypothetical protein